MNYDQANNLLSARSRLLYSGMVSAMDEAIGKVIKTYKDVGFWNNTILVFSTGKAIHQSQGLSVWGVGGIAMKIRYLNDIIRPGRYLEMLSLT